MILNDYSATIGSEVNSALASFGTNPEKWTGYTWKSKNPEYLYVTTRNGDTLTTQRFHFFLFAGKIAQTKETSDKIYYRLSDATLQALAATKAGQTTPAVPAPTKKQ